MKTMENKKETAIDWLEDIIKGSIQDKLVIEVLTSIFNQAKAMHKQEIEDAYTESRCEWNEIKSSTDYYNETYGK